MATNPYLARAQGLQDQNFAEQREKKAEALKLQTAPLSQALQADQMRLTAYSDPQGNPLPQYEKQHKEVMDRMTQTIGKLREIYGQKAPGQDPSLLDKLHITNHLKSHTPEGRAAALKDWNAQNSSRAGSYAAGALPYEMTPEGRKLKMQGENAINVAKTRAEFGTGVTRHTASLTPQNAIKFMHTTGAQYFDAAGEPITEEMLSEFPPNTMLMEFRQGSHTFYSPADQNAQTLNVGGQIYQRPQIGGILGNVTDLGRATSTLPRESTVTATSPGGTQVVTGTTTRQQVAPGINAAPANGATAPGTEPTLHTRPTTAPVTPPAGPVARKNRTAQDESRVSTEGILPNIQNMTPNNARMAQKAQPAVTAELGLFGDPTKPGVKSMVDFADLADDPHAQQVLGTAFKLLDQEMGDISQPGMIATLGSAMGWAGFKAKTEAGVQQEAGTDMTPEEKEYFDTAIASMADIIGSRAATGQSPARFSVKAMQNELPMIGTSSVTDSNSYKTKMNTIARQIEVGLNGMPDNGRALAWMRKRQKEIQGGKPVAQTAGKSHKIKIGDKFYTYNGNGDTANLKNYTEVKQ